MNLGIRFTIIKRRFSKRRELWVLSTWTGECVRPWQLARVYQMVRSYKHHLIQNEFDYLAG